ncbi:MAG: DUF262 domain-containing protein [Candidatus Taylorbacteria bacterium]|nr:DUF262 domain-containing protein [Candidatus Taylorbacteria bacterium]
MKIELHQIPIHKIVDGYKNSEEEGVVGFSGKLNIRPKYQREFIYKPEQQIAVINSVMGGFPLNAMYWVKNSDGSFEILDGQQRTVSICNFLAGDFNVVNRGYQMYFENLTEEEKMKIRDYTLMVYFCEGKDDEKLAWFRVINTAGEKLTPQELLNAIYSGPWVTDAKRYFSKSNAPAYLLAHDYVSGALNRQEYLETVLRWISNDKIEDYMGKHQKDKDAGKLWEYFQDVIAWVQKTFPNYRREMAHVEWGELYNEFKNKKLDPKKLEKEITELMQDEDVTKKSGIYPYVLTRQEKYLNIRAFTDKMKREAYERQKGICPFCKGENKKKKWDISEMEADHITPWHEGGKTVAENCQMLCKEHNRTKSGE